MTCITSSLRETVERAPSPTGNFDGQSRASALKALLNKHEEQFRDNPSWLTKILRRRRLRRLGISVSN